MLEEQLLKLINPTSHHPSNSVTSFLLCFTEAGKERPNRDGCHPRTWLHVPQRLGASSSDCPIAFMHQHMFVANSRPTPAWIMV